MRKKSFKAILEWITEPLTERPFNLSRAVGYIILVFLVCRLLWFYVEMVQIAINLN